MNEHFEKTRKFSVNRDRILNLFTSGILIFSDVGLIGAIIFFFFFNKEEIAIIAVVSWVIAESLAFFCLCYLAHAVKKRRDYIKNFTYLNAKDYIDYCADNKGNILLLDIFAHGIWNMIRNSGLDEGFLHDDFYDKVPVDIERKKLIVISFFRNTLTYDGDGRLVRKPSIYLGLKLDKNRKKADVDRFEPLKELCREYKEYWDGRFNHAELIDELKKTEAKYKKNYHDKYSKYELNDTRKVVGEAGAIEFLTKTIPIYKYELSLKRSFLITAGVIMIIQIYSWITHANYSEIVDMFGTISFEIITAVLLFIELQKEKVREYLF